MKRQFLTISVLFSALFIFCACNSVSPNTESGLDMQKNTLTEKQKADNRAKVYQFLKKAGTYYIATVEGEQPRVRPFGTIHQFDGKLYIQTGKSKKVSKQIGANGKVELCAMYGKRWIRLSGTLVNDDRREAKVSMLEEYPALKSMYTPDDPNTQVLYFVNATAVITGFGEKTEILKF